MTAFHLVAGFWIACLVALLLLLAWSERGHASEQPTVCVSAVGPVDADGQGDTTPELRCQP